MMKNKNIAIIGAGLTGLTAGYELGKKGHKVTIFEKGNDVGGLMGGFEIEGTSLEKGYHHIFRTDKYIIALTKELGLLDKLKWYPESVAIFYKGKIYPFVGAIDLLKFNPIGIMNRLRTGMVALWLQKDKNWQKYKNIPAYLWMKKWCGQKAYKVIWVPLLKGKFHQYYDKVSMAWLWARINTRGNSKTKGTSGENLGYFEGGFRIIADELTKRIKNMGGSIKLDSEVDFGKIEKDFDKILFTGAAKDVNYLGAVIMIFESEQNLSRYYWHNINDSNSPFLAFIQHTNLINKSNYGGKHVYYLGTYLPHDHKYFKDDERLIRNDFYQYLKKIFPDFERGQIESDWVFRLKNAQHIVDCNYKIPPYKISEKVYQANFAQVFPEDRGTNYAVREGIKIADMIG